MEKIIKFPLLSPSSHPHKTMSKTHFLMMVGRVIEWKKLYFLMRMGWGETMVLSYPHCLPLVHPPNTISEPNFPHEYGVK